MCRDESGRGGSCLCRCDVGWLCVSVSGALECEKKEVWVRVNEVEGWGERVFIDRAGSGVCVCYDDNII